MLTYLEALALVLAQRLALGHERVTLEAAQGRVLSAPLLADRDHPPFDRVAMDGIAIHYAAYAAGQRNFPVAWLQAAGDAPRPLEDITRCVEIMTGAALPPGCTTVVRYEDLEAGEGTFRLPEGLEDGAHLHRRGKDSLAGAMLAPAGQRIGVAEIGMLATCGYAGVEVSKRPRVMVVATGNELVPVSEVPLPHQIRQSNLYQVGALLAGQGLQPTLKHLRDDPELIRSALAQALEDYEVIVLSGGVSMGKLDFIPQVLRELGVRQLLHGVAQRPGKPLWVGRRGETMVFGLPGNPVSTLCCAVHYVLPFLMAQAGLPPPPPEYAQLTEDCHFAAPLTLFQLVALRSDAATGTLLATPTRNAGSGDSTSLLRSAAFLELPPDRAHFRRGEVFPLRRW
ncbi:molybdopterin molybdotransferase MoeA [Lewinella lacunae]|uniref:Molybdopterin molybdenumtransferase n=1 Tax=Neolewinella lacunae TaxID=1517758 RepID=A0A923T774_9BACT|nr:molybdopterin molybdotransferase MoeA [Neolewinella lacunae]